MSKNNSSPDRQAINKHLYRMHLGWIGTGSTLNRQVEHDHLHAKGNEGIAGYPPHSHGPGGIAEIQLLEGEE